MRCLPTLTSLRKVNEINKLEAPSSEQDALEVVF